MSHYISDEKYIISNPVICVPNRKIIGSKYKNILKDFNDPNKKHQTKYIRNIYKDLYVKEKYLNKRKNEEFIKQKYK